MSKHTLRKKRYKERLFKAQEGLCFFCGGPMKESSATLDHLIPKSIGSKGKSSCVLCHEHCNHKKGDRLPTSQEVVKFWDVSKQIHNVVCYKLEEFRWLGVVSRGVISRYKRNAIK